MLENKTEEQAKELANKYYKLSADQGNKDAQFHYSLNLQEGAGVPQDEDKTAI